MDLLWIAWERHRRTLELCRFLHTEPVLLTCDLPRAVKHPYLLLRSGWILVRKRPRTLVVQNPSIALTLLACLLRGAIGYKLIVDTHNAGIQPENPWLARLAFLYRYFQRQADLTIVTSGQLAEVVKEHGGTPLVLPDKLPEVARLWKRNLEGIQNIVCICTFGQDEPYAEVIRAASLVPETFRIYVTGDCRKLGQPLAAEARGCKQIVFTGYLEDEEYWNLLYSCDLAVDLTKRDACLVCGAYEAVAVGTPLLLSDHGALREYFWKGALFTSNRPEDIAVSMEMAFGNLERLRREVEELKGEIIGKWSERGEALRSAIFR